MCSELCLEVRDGLRGMKSGGQRRKMCFLFQDISVSLDRHLIHFSIDVKGHHDQGNS